MKVCLLSYRANPCSGGQGVYVGALAAEMARQGMDVHVVMAPPCPDHIPGVSTHVLAGGQFHGRSTRDIVREGINPLAAPLDAGEYLASRAGSFAEINAFTFRAWPLVRSLHRRHGFDIIHDNQSLGYGLLLMKRLGIPVIATVHHPLTVDRLRILESERTFAEKVKGMLFYPLVMQGQVARRLDHLVTVSRASREAVVRDMGVRVERVSVIHNGIDHRLYGPQQGARQRSGILYVGNVEDGNKGFEYLLKALKTLPPAVRLTVVDGAVARHRRSGRAMRLLGVSDRVTFTGKISDGELARLYGTAAVAVVPSVFEGFGLPALQAISCGVPLVTTGGGALPEVVGDAALVVPPRDPGALAAAIGTILGNPSIADRLSAAGRGRAQGFSWERAARELGAVYAGIAGKI